MFRTADNKIFFLPKYRTSIIEVTLENLFTSTFITIRRTHPTTPPSDTNIDIIIEELLSIIRFIAKEFILMKYRVIASINWYVDRDMFSFWIFIVYNFTLLHSQRSIRLISNFVNQFPLCGNRISSMISQFESKIPYHPINTH